MISGNERRFIHKISCILRPDTLVVRLCTFQPVFIETSRHGRVVPLVLVLARSSELVPCGRVEDQCARNAREKQELHARAKKIHLVEVPARVGGDIQVTGPSSFLCKLGMQKR